MWVTKYRQRLLTRLAATRGRDSLRELCAHDDFFIIQGHVAKDYNHLFVSLPPQMPLVA